VLITKDEDFVGLVQRSPSGPTLVWIKLGNTRNRVLLAAVSRALPGVIEAIAAGERLIVIE
jgi:predicted nuclease of predicted toxin-antitoxin system